MPWENAMHGQSLTLSAYCMCHFRVSLKRLHTSDWIPHEKSSLFEWNDINVYTVIKMQEEEISQGELWTFDDIFLSIQVVLHNILAARWLMALGVSLLSLMFNVFKRQEHPVYEGLMFDMGDKALGHTHYSSMEVSSTHRDGFLPSRGTQIKLCCRAVSQQCRSALKERQWRRGRCPFSDYRLFFFLTKDPSAAASNNYLDFNSH